MALEGLVAAGLRAGCLAAGAAGPSWTWACRFVRGWEFFCTAWRCSSPPCTPDCIRVRICDSCSSF